MKTNRVQNININSLEKLLIGFLVVVLVMIVGLGTYAYFNVSKTSDISFTMISYDPDNPPNPDNPDNPSDGFAIKVYEHDSNGNEVLNQTYRNVIPGQKLSKDPTVANIGKYDMWVRVNVLFTKASSWKAICNKHHLDGPIMVLRGINSDWYYADDAKEDSVNDTIMYSFYYKNGLSSNQKAILFNRIDIPFEFDDGDMARLGTFQVKITADAIQKANTGNDCYGAFKDYWSND